MSPDESMFEAALLVKIEAEHGVRIDDIRVREWIDNSSVTRRSAFPGAISITAETP